jgi:hypothetical protein
MVIAQRNLFFCIESRGVIDGNGYSEFAYRYRKRISALWVTPGIDTRAGLKGKFNARSEKPGDPDRIFACNPSGTLFL